MPVLVLLQHISVLGLIYHFTSTWNSTFSSPSPFFSSSLLSPCSLANSLSFSPPLPFSFFFSSNLVHRGVYKNKLNLNLGKTGKPVLVKIKFRYDTCINLVICTTRNWIRQTFQSESFKYFFFIYYLIFDICNFELEER